jgi:TldD protein
MLDLLCDLMAVAAGRCAYAEARHVETRAETLAVRGGHVELIDATTSEGIGVRVRVGGGWGFAATGRTDRAGAEAALAQALAIAQAQPSAPATALAPVAPAHGHWRSGFEVDPFAGPLEDKLALLFAAEAALRTGDARLVRTEASARAGRALTRMRLFAASVGADVAALYSIPSGRDYATPLSGRVSVSRRVRCA